MCVKTVYYSYYFMLSQVPQKEIGIIKMASKTTAQNDEIDLFELGIILWQGKRVIIAASALCAILGALYIALTPIYSPYPSAV